MDDRKFILQETAIVAAGEALCTAAAIGVFALLGKFDLGVLLGGAVGCVVAVANFFFMAITAAIASRRAMAQDVEGGKKLVKTSQIYRLIGVGAVLGLCAAGRAMNIITLLLPLVFQRPVLMIAEFFRKKGG